MTSRSYTPKKKSQYFPQLARYYWNNLDQVNHLYGTSTPSPRLQPIFHHLYRASMFILFPPTTRPSVSTGNDASARRPNHHSSVPPIVNRSPNYFLSSLLSLSLKTTNTLPPPPSVILIVIAKTNTPPNLLFPVPVNSFIQSCSYLFTNPRVPTTLMPPEHSLEQTCTSSLCTIRIRITLTPLPFMITLPLHTILLTWKA